MSVFAIIWVCRPVSSLAGSRDGVQLNCEYLSDYAVTLAVQCSKAGAIYWINNCNDDWLGKNCITRNPQKWLNPEMAWILVLNNIGQIFSFEIYRSGPRKALRRTKRESDNFIWVNSINYLLDMSCKKSNTPSSINQKRKTLEKYFEFLRTELYVLFVQLNLMYLNTCFCQLVWSVVCPSVHLFVTQFVLLSTKKFSQSL